MTRDEAATHIASVLTAVEVVAKDENRHLIPVEGVMQDGETVMRFAQRLLELSLITLYGSTADIMFPGMEDEEGLN